LTSKAPPGIRKIHEKNKTKLINKTIRECDIVVMDLNTTPVWECEQIIAQLKDNTQLNTTVVLLSNLMTWYKTPKKADTVIAEGEEEAEADKQEEEERVEDFQTILKDLQVELTDVSAEQAKDIIEKVKASYKVKDVVQETKMQMKVFTEDD